MSENFTDNAAARRYELEVDGRLAYADYRRDGEVIVLPYVYADPELRGSGAAGRLLEQVVTLARTENLRIKPVCGYAVAWMRRHPEHADILG